MPYTFPTGSLAFIGEETDYLNAGDDPLQVFSSLDGSLLQSIAGFDRENRSRVKVLPTGELLVPNENYGTGEARIFDTHLNVIGSTIDISGLFNNDGINPPAITATGTNTVDRFFIGGAGGGVGKARFTWATKLGVLGPTVWELPSAGLIQIVGSPDNTIAYHYGQSSSKFTEIKRWDLVNDVALSDLAPRIWSDTTDLTKTMKVSDLRVLADGTILVSYSRYSSGHADDSAFIRRYATDGSTLNTYTLPATVGLAFGSASLAEALDDPATFWVFFPNVAYPGFKKTVRHYRTSDGAVLLEFDVSVNTADDPTSYLNGASFWVTRIVGPVTPTTPPPVFVNSTPTCCAKGGASSAGPVEPQESPAWTPSCAGGGVPPGVADVGGAEAWDY